MNPARARLFVELAMRASLIGCIFCIGRMGWAALVTVLLICIVGYE